MLKNLSCVKIPLISSLANLLHNDKLSQDSSKIPRWSLVNHLLFPASILIYRDTVKVFYTPQECNSEQLFPLFQKKFCTQSACKIILILVFVASNSPQYLISLKKVLFTLTIKNKKGKHETTRQDSHSVFTQQCMACNSKVFSPQERTRTGPGS